MQRGIGGCQGGIINIARTAHDEAPYPMRYFIMHPMPSPQHLLFTKTLVKCARNS